MLTLVKRNGNIHVRDTDNNVFVRHSYMNIASAVRTKGYKVTFVTKAQILANCRFDEDGNLLEA